MSFGRGFRKPAIVITKKPKRESERDGRKIKKHEERLQKQFASYVRRQYPDLVFTSEVSGLWSGEGGGGYALASKLKAERSRHKHLDMFFSEARGGWFGLYIELKDEGKEVYRKDGGFIRQKGTRRVGKVDVEFDHLEEQRGAMDNLRKKGYLCFFGIGFDNCKKIIDDYMKLPPTTFSITEGGMNTEKYTYEKDREVLRRKPKGKKEKE